MSSSSSNSSSSSSSTAAEQQQNEQQQQQQQQIWRDLEQKKLQVFDQWLQENGAGCDAIEHVLFEEDFRGVAIKSQAEHALQKGELVMQIPLPCIITSEVAATSIIGRKLQRMGCKITSKQCFMAVYLLEEMHAPQSFWTPYFDILPQKLEYMPALFEDATLNYLDASPIWDAANSRKRRYQSDYDEICRIVPRFRKVASLQQFSWARIIVQSRVFGFHINNKKTSGMVPMADMVNHSANSNAIWAYKDALNAFVLIGKHALHPGDAVLDSYGKRGHSGYFLDYGMVLENPVDVVTVRVHLPADDVLKPGKTTLLGRGLETYELTPLYSQDPTRLLFNFARIARANATELATIRHNHKLAHNSVSSSSPASLSVSPLPQFVDLKIMGPVCLANEVRILRFLHDTCVEQLALYSCDLSTDQKILDVQTDNNIRNCILVRMGEKRVFQHYITLYQLVLKSFHDMFVETEQQQQQQQHSVDIQSLLVDAFALANKHILNYLHAVFVPMAAKSTEEDIVALRQELLTNHTTTTTSTATVQTPSEEGGQPTKVSSAAEEVKAIDT